MGRGSERQLTRRSLLRATGSGVLGGVWFATGTAAGDQHQHPKGKPILELDVDEPGYRFRTGDTIVFEVSYRRTLRGHTILIYSPDARGWTTRWKLFGGFKAGGESGTYYVEVEPDQYEIAVTNGTIRARAAANCLAFGPFAPRFCDSESNTVTLREV